MAVGRQNHRTRRECAGGSPGAPSRTKPSSEMNRICRELPELLRCASPRPRDGQQWALEVPLQRATQAGPKPPSREVCDQRTRGRAGAHAGPEPVIVSGRNRHNTGKMRVAQQHVHGIHKPLLLTFLLCLGPTVERSSKKEISREERIQPARQPNLLAKSRHSRGDGTGVLTHPTH
eukprot:391587-Pleurochrysis_carterae.AAC.1